MSTEERIAVLENENTNNKREITELHQDLKSVKEALSDVKFKVKIMWGSILTILSGLGVAFVNFLLE